MKDLGLRDGWCWSMGWVFLFVFLFFSLSSFSRVDILLADWFGSSLHWLFVHERETDRDEREREIDVMKSTYIYAYMLRREE